MKNKIITISRQYGSGGRQVGKLLSEQYNMRFFDKELLEEAAKKSGISKELFLMHDEKPTGSFLFSLVSDGYFAGYPSMNSYSDMPLSQRVFLAQFDAIKNIADREDCVIVGRCADYALADYDNVLNVFIMANMDTRTENVSKDLNIPNYKARELIAKTDKRRASYYNYYTNKKWGVCDSYHLSIDSSIIGVEGCVDVIMNCSKVFFGE